MKPMTSHLIWWIYGVNVVVGKVELINLKMKWIIDKNRM